MAVPSQMVQAGQGELSCRAQPAARSLPLHPQRCSSRDSPEPKQAKLDPGQQKVPPPDSVPHLASPSPAHRSSTIIQSPPPQDVTLPACPSPPVPCTHRWHSCQTQECRPALGRKSARPLLWIWEEKRSRRRCP